MKSNSEKVYEVSKGNWKVEVSIDGKIITSVEGNTEDQAIDNVLNKSIIDLVKEADDVDLTVDIVKTWMDGK